MQPVADIIKPSLAVLFVGFNPGLRSAQTGQHFAGHSNRFWKLLAESDLTPRLLQPEESDELLNYDLGITNIVDRPSKTAAEISKDEYAAGRIKLKQKLAVYQPKVACYAGIGVYREFAQRAKISCGLQNPSVVPGIIDFVVPSPSGLNRVLFKDQLEWYLQLQQILCSPYAANTKSET